MSRRTYPAAGSSQDSERESLLSSATEPGDVAKQYGTAEAEAVVTWADDERQTRECRSLVYACLHHLLRAGQWSMRLPMNAS